MNFDAGCVPADTLFSKGYFMENAVSIECEHCSLKIRGGAQIGCVVLALAQGAGGIFGLSEALAAAGIVSLFQGYRIYREGRNRQNNSFIAIIAAGIFFLAILDIFVFSFWKLLGAYQGTLPEPKAYTFLIALFSILAGSFLSSCSSCNTQAEFSRLRSLFRLGILVSVMVAAGVILSRTVWLYGDPLAALLIGAILVSLTSGTIGNGLRRFGEFVRKSRGLR